MDITQVNQINYTHVLNPQKIFQSTLCHEAEIQIQQFILLFHRI